MQCSFCTNVALRHAGIGKKLRGFCRDHTQEAFNYSALLLKPKIVGTTMYEAGVYNNSRGIMERGDLPVGKKRDYIRHTL